MEGEKISQPSQPNGHRTDAIGTKFVDKTGELQDKAAQHGKGPKKEGSQPAGGLDKTPIPSRPPGYTVKFTFHRATNLPMADINTLSSDPYVKAILKTELPTRHKQDPDMQFRTATIRRDTEPVWNAEWIVANVPSSGFELKARIYDEDPADHDDRLGNVHVHVESLNENWGGIKEHAYQIKKRMGSKRAYMIRGCAAMFLRGLHMSGELLISVEVLGRTDTDNGGRPWTIGPCNWTQHLSPMIGRLAGTKEPGQSKEGQTEKYNFQANQFQLQGPVPHELYHRYVEFKPFVAGMFTSHSLRGRILNRALHHQHTRVYNYDKTTVYGSFPHPCKDMTLKFLDLVHYDSGGRIYTYVLNLDSQWRFTETGKEFGIDLLSKHTMHSDVSNYIAYSGEFFIRRLKSPYKRENPLDQQTHPPADLSGGPPDDDPPKDPAYYCLVIDNDSGTYRPAADYLDRLKAFMQRNLPGMKIMTLDCNGDKERMEAMKKEQRERKKKERNDVAYIQDDGDSLSSSDEEELERRGEHDDDAGPKKQGKLEKAMGAVAEPKNKVEEWAQGDREREERETEEDMGHGLAQQQH